MKKNNCFIIFARSRFLYPTILVPRTACKHLEKTRRQKTSVDIDKKYTKTTNISLLYFAIEEDHLVSFEKEGEGCGAWYFEGSEPSVACYCLCSRPHMDYIMRNLLNKPFLSVKHHTPFITRLLLEIIARNTHTHKWHGFILDQLFCFIREICATVFFSVLVGICCVCFCIWSPLTEEFLMTDFDWLQMLYIYKWQCATIRNAAVDPTLLPLL